MGNSFEAARLNGQVATTTSMVEMDLTAAHMKGLSLHVVYMLIPMIFDVGREVHGEILADIAKIVDAGGLQPVVDEQQFALEDISAAHIRMKSGQALGKVVVEI